MAFFATIKGIPLRPMSVGESIGEVERLRTTNGQLQRAVSSHALVDQAIGVVVVLAGVDPATAWEVLREISQRTNTKLSTVAADVLDFAQGAFLSGRVRDELRTAFASHCVQGGREASV
ncbi:ANTAR domain-containing protein [Streptomyces sp. NPDC006739]|uniref:ANTAR domain-containing protein n=1 Tax=Streptomyces sp. NPDC006739 TaxID=3364763 RepID=UPI00367F7198